jgi:hypothetical protein
MARRSSFDWLVVPVAAKSLGPSKEAALGSVTGCDEFIVAEGLATALVALEQVPPVPQPTPNIADMKT